VTGPLQEPLSPDQEHLLRVIYQPFGQSGEWPLWQYVDLTLDAQRDLDAAAVLASLPRLGSQGTWRYALTWRQDSHMQPQPGNPIMLTVAGLRHLHEAEPLLGAFLTTIRYLVDQQRQLIPSPTKVVEATVKSTAIKQEILTASIHGSSGPPVDVLMGKLREVIGKEPFLHSAVSRPNSHDWEIRVPAVLRAYRGVATIDDYLDRVTELIAPPEPPPVPPSFGALDVPYAVGFLDAVWMSRTRSHLFVNLDPASTARLTQPCADEADFNSLMAALADVLGQAVPPGTATPPQRGALEAVGRYVASILEGEAAERAADAIGMLIHLRHIRVSTQHADARHRAVTAFRKIGMTFPPPAWEGAWAGIAAQAKGALDVLREEIHAAAIASSESH
jgi:hypothetical protein